MSDNVIDLTSHIASAGKEGRAWDAAVKARTALAEAELSLKWNLENLGSNSMYTKIAGDQVVRARAASRAATELWLSATAGDVR
jgi:hypothetical protein